MRKSDINFFTKIFFPKNLIFFFREIEPCQSHKIHMLELARKTLFGVKTCEKFHSERLPVIFETWGKAALNIQYFSELADPDYGTVHLQGVRNTERVCNKLKYLAHLRLKIPHLF